MGAQAINMTVEETEKDWRRGFWSVWATQFQESFSDNAFRWIVISFIGISKSLCKQLQSFFGFTLNF